MLRDDKLPSFTSWHKIGDYFYNGDPEVNGTIRMGTFGGHFCFQERRDGIYQLAKTQTQFLTLNTDFKLSNWGDFLYKAQGEIEEGMAPYVEVNADGSNGDLIMPSLSAFSGYAPVQPYDADDTGAVTSGYDYFTPATVGPDDSLIKELWVRKGASNATGAVRLRFYEADTAGVISSTTPKVEWIWSQTDWNAGGDIHADIQNAYQVRVGQSYVTVWDVSTSPDGEFVVDPSGTFSLSGLIPSPAIPILNNFAPWFAVNFRTLTKRVASTFDISQGGSGVSTDGAGIVDFNKDELGENIILDNGKVFAHNVLKAVEDTNTNTISLVNKVFTDQIYYTDIPYESVRIGGADTVDNLNAVVNALNQYFTKQPNGVTSQAVSPVVDLVGASTTLNSTSYTIDPVGDAVLAGTGQHYHRQNAYTTETISNDGEYYTFSIQGEGIIGMGLYDADADDLTELQNESLGSSGHYGFLYSHWLHPTPDGPWTNYGSNTSYVQLSGWTSTTYGFRYNSGWAQGDVVSMKVGLDDGFIYVAFWDPTLNQWTKIARTSYRVPENTGGYGLAIKFGDANPKLYTAPLRHVANPAVTPPRFFAIESPDDSWHYPLASTPEDAVLMDETYGTAGAGLGTYHSHVFVDDPFGTVYYMPTTIEVHDSATDPRSFSSDPNSVYNNVFWNIVSTESDHLHAPDPFTIPDLSIDELASVNYQVTPLDASFQVTVTGLPSGLSYVGTEITGTAPEVLSDNVTNPNDSYTITVTRTNSFGSTSTTFDIIVNNTTSTVITPITGFTHQAGSTALVDSDTLDEGSVVAIDETIADQQRMIINQTWIEANILPKMTEDGDIAYIGLPVGSVDWTSVDDSDFLTAIKLERTSSTGHRSSLISTIDTDNMLILNSLTDAYYDYAFELDGTDLHVIACNFNDINSQVHVNHGGQFSRTITHTGVTGPVTIVIGTNGMQADISATGLSEIVIPRPSNWIQVTEQTHVLYFEGSTTMPTLQAGYTYRFLVGDYEYDDQTTNTGLHADEVIRFTSDGSTEYTGMTVTRVGTVGVNGSYIEFTLPTDVPPLWWYTDHDGINQNNGVSISGSTYTATVTGITLEGPVANQTGTNIADNGDWGWMSIDETLSAGERFVMDNAFFTDLLAEMGDQYEIRIGLKGTSWTNGDHSTYTNSVVSGEIFRGNIQLRIYKSSSNNIYFQIFQVGVSNNQMLVNTVALHNDTCAFIEVTSNGDEIRFGFGRNGNLSVTQGDESTVAYADWNAYKATTGNQGYGITSLDVMFLVTDIFNGNGDNYDGANVDWTHLSEVTVPTPAVTNLTSWTKAVDFSGGSEHLAQVTNNYGVTPLNMGNANTTNVIPTAGYTVSSGHPWAVSSVFYHDGNSSNQHIWNHGEGAGSTDDNIYLRVTSTGELYFGWGRSGDLNECLIATNLQPFIYHAVYVGFNGARLSGANATSSNLAQCFDIRMMSENDSFLSLGSNLSTSVNWTSGSTGGRMDRQFTGRMWFGGRGGNRNWHGKHAGSVVTTLLPNSLMPSDVEIKTMITDPVKWLADYKVGQNYRASSSSNASSGFALNHALSSYATQVWLMGDASSDSYANGIRNYVDPSDQNYTKLQFNNMVSNDIQNVNITGL
jgi:hypothetical protein